MKRASDENYAFAKSMRRAPTPAEKRLCGNLRNRALIKRKFVRQWPIGPYIVDFLCRDRRLIVEVDGETHSTAREFADDLRRTEFLNAAGYRVHRVWNLDVYHRLNDVMDGIAMALIDCPSSGDRCAPPPSPPEGEKGKK
jgi:very-short-patch-repair endonuclease